MPEDTIVATGSPRGLQERLKQAAIRDRDLDLEISRDWFAVDRDQSRDSKSKKSGGGELGPMRNLPHRATPGNRTTPKVVASGWVCFSLPAG
jgi:hypothetical protein